MSCTSTTRLLYSSPWLWDIIFEAARISVSLEKKGFPVGSFGRKWWATNVTYQRADLIVKRAVISGAGSYQTTPFSNRFISNGVSAETTSWERESHFFDIANHEIIREPLISSCWWWTYTKHIAYVCTICHALVIIPNNPVKPSRIACFFFFLSLSTLSSDPAHPYVSILHLAAPSSWVSRTFYRIR